MNTTEKLTTHMNRRANNGDYDVPFEEVEKRAEENPNDLNAKRALRMRKQIGK